MELENVMEMNTKCVPVRTAACLIVAFACLAVYMLTPSRTDYLDARVNLLFSQCSSSLLEDEFKMEPCEELYRTYANISRSTAYHYISDNVMFKLHGEISKLGYSLDINQVTDGFMQKLPSGKYHTTRRNNIIDALISTPTESVDFDYDGGIDASL